MNVTGLFCSRTCSTYSSFSFFTTHPWFIDANFSLLTYLRSSLQSDSLLCAFYLQCSLLLTSHKILIPHSYFLTSTLHTFHWSFVTTFFSLLHMPHCSVIILTLHCSLLTPHYLFTTPHFNTNLTPHFHCSLIISHSKFLTSHSLFIQCLSLQFTSNSFSLLLSHLLNSLYCSFIYVYFSLFTTHFSLITLHCSILTSHCSHLTSRFVLLTSHPPFHYSILRNHCSLLGLHCLKLITASHSSLSTANPSPITAHSSLIMPNSLLITRYYSLVTSHCPITGPLSLLKLLTPNSTLLTSHFQVLF